MRSLRISLWLSVVALLLAVPALQAQLVISEFLASNSRGLTDSDGDRPDWIELWNSGNTPVNLQGWSLTDDASLPRKWVFPQIVLAPGAYQVVFASGKNRTNAAAALHTGFSLSTDGEYLALFPPEGLQPASEFSPAYPPQRPDISYGIRDGQRYYFNPPSPGAPNTGGVGDFVADTQFSVDRGVFDQPFDLQITCSTVGASIRYTTNGAPPTPTTGFLYTNTLRIARTTVIRAAAFKDGLQPSNADTQTYLFPSDIIRQQPTGTAPSAEWPSPGSQSQTFNYGMDPRVVDAPAYASQIVPALKALPSFCLVTTLSNLFNPATGIYSNPGQDGRDWERPASAELIFPDGRKGFQIDCGIRIRGGYSRSTGNPKHAFRLFFREQYGAAKLRFPLHAGGVEEFDAFDLRTFQNYSWSFDPGDGSNGIFIRDVFSRDTQLAMGQQGERGNYYHLYINGVYWGIYNSAERAEANFGANYFGGLASDYDVVKVEAGPYTINATDGTLDAWTRLYNLCKAITAANAETTFWRVQGRNPDGSPNSAYENLLEIDNLIDYMLVIVFGGNLDAPISNFLGNTRPNNWYGLRDRTGTHGGFRFISHDAEHTLLDVNQNRVGPFSAGSDSLLYSNPQYLWQQLWQSTSFRLRVADRIQKHFFNGGALTTASAQARFAQRTNQLYAAVVAESARWGDSKVSTPLTRDGHWLPAVGRILNNYLPARGAIVLNQLRAANLWPTLAAPVLSHPGGIVPPGFQLSLSNPGTGTISYTLDGTDPRSPTGTLAPSARSYSGPLPITSGTLVKARVRRSTAGADEWSPLIETTFLVSQDTSGLRLSELHYHPAADPAPAQVPADDYEFIELKNQGSTSIDLSGFQFIDGIQLGFPLGTRLEPGRFLLLVSNPDAFTRRYPGAIPAFAYSGQLSNSGEHLALADPAGQVVLRIDYGTSTPWPSAADGLGFSLVPRDPTAQPAPTDGTAWRASTRIGGSPGVDDAPSGLVPVVINEIRSHTDLPELDAIELHNPSDTPADIGGWWLSDDPARPFKFRIPTGTSLPARGLIVFDESHFNTPGLGTNAFRLSAFGDEAALFSADADGRLSGHVDIARFDTAFNGETFNRFTNSSSVVSWVRSTTPTLGSPNSPPRLSPVVLQEILHTPGPRGAAFVELWNRTSSPVPLHDPANPTHGWRISGIDFTFPEGFTLPPDGRVVVTETDPATFRRAYSLTPAQPVFGPWPGRLQANGERIELKQPDAPTPVTNSAGLVSIITPYVTVDAVRYDSTPPWPVATAAGDVSLERRVPTAFGDEALAWRAALAGPTPGSAADANRPPKAGAGPDRELTSTTFPLAVTLEGWATDDGLPEGSSLSLRWQQISGPPGAVFRSANTSNTVVELPGQGVYVLRWTAQDGERETSDEVQVTVARSGNAATLVPFGSTWRYFDQRQDLGTGWRERGFSDSSWASGKARLGYGGDGEVTSINGGPSNDRIPTAYFRLRFNIPSAQAVKDLKVQLIRDDGAVVYLNGTEVFRSAMPEGPISFSTFASITAGGADETAVFEQAIPASALVDGDNVLAVEVHQANASSSDIGMDLALSGTLLGSNSAPTVKAGTGGEITLPAPAALRATFTDDGLPMPPGTPTFTWSRVSGPGTVSFDPPDSPASTARFSAPGTYVLRFTAHDGLLSASDTVTLTVKAPPTPPILSITPEPVRLRFEAQSGVAYTVRFRTRLDDSAWMPFQTIPAGPARIIELSDPAAESQRFFQVLVGP